MASRAVYAVSLQRARELFLGYTTLTTDDPVALLNDVFGRMSQARMSQYAVMASGTTLSIEGRDIPAGDRWLHRAEHNQHLDGGQPYIRDLSVSGLVVVDPATGDDVLLETNESDGSVPFVNSNGVEQRLKRNATTGKLDLVEEDGTERTLSLVPNIPQEVQEL